MNNEAIRCDELPLELLLSDADGSDELRAMTQHIEHCRSCQSRLTTLAADATWWSDAKELLGGSSEFSWKSDPSQFAEFALGRARDRESLETEMRKLLAAPSHPELLGRLGRYDVERVIGAGGMGIVLKAHDGELNRPIAIKVLASHLAHVGAARERFAREGRAAAAVVHEHVVAIYNVESDGEMPFLVMQYVPGRSLESRVDAEGPLAVEEILRIGMQAAGGLAAAHAQGLVHRDVKPSNILLEDTVERAVLTDFGLARAIDDASLTHTGVLAGTPHYMSPEQASGEAIDHRSDLFSLGAVLYFMATGHPPFRADGALAVLHRLCREPHRPVWERNKDVPDELSDLIDRLLEKRPGRRPASAAVVRDELAAILRRYQQFGPGRRFFGGLRSRRQRRNLLGVVAAALAGVLIIAAVYQSTTSRPSETGAPPPSPHSSAEIAQEVAEVVEQESAFASELAAARNAVEQSEFPAYSAPAGVDDWQMEVDAVKRDLMKIETEQGLSP